LLIKKGGIWHKSRAAPKGVKKIERVAKEVPPEGRKKKDHS